MKIRMKTLLFTGIVLALVLAGTGAFVALRADNGAFDEMAWRAAVQAVDPALFRAPHFADGKYFNPWMNTGDRGGLLRFLSWRFAGRETFAAEEEEYLPAVTPRTAAEIAGRDNYAMWLGHASVLVRLNGVTLIVDPVLGDIPFVATRRTPAALSSAEAGALAGPLYVLLTHNHYDHLDEESIRSFPAGTKFIVPVGLASTLRDMGAKDVVEMDWWQERNADGVTVAFVPSQHWSKRTPFDTNTSLWGSYVLQAKGKTVFVGGDSGYFLGYREIAKTYPAPDLAFMSAGAYRPRWFMHFAHQDEREAAQAADDLRAKRWVPVHWGAFRLGDEPAGHPGVSLRRMNPRGLHSAGVGEIIPL
jgi:N-acyl-phosphatidylethanolamine-hydrolysing phospholipase D